jgi:formylmethanofuran dehydrogenase subunit E
MKGKRRTLKEAIKFHGHLGPYLVLGILLGDFALKKLKCKKYFGIKVKVWGANKKPKSCLIDGLQLATGATYGKGNIHKLNSNNIRILIHNLKNNKKIKICFKNTLINRLNSLKGHRDSQDFAKELVRLSPTGLFEFKS